MIVYLIKFKPFKFELQQVIWTSDEFTIVFGLWFLILLFKYQTDQNTSLKLSFVIIGVISASLFKNLSVIFYNLIIDAYRKIRKIIRNKIDYTKNKKERLRKEVEDRKEKERIAKENKLLLKNSKNITNLNNTQTHSLRNNSRNQTWDNSTENKTVRDLIENEIEPVRNQSPPKVKALSLMSKMKSQNLTLTR